MKRAVTLQIPFESTPPWLYLSIRDLNMRRSNFAFDGPRLPDSAGLLKSFGVPENALVYLADVRLAFESLSIEATFVDMSGLCSWMPQCSPGAYPMNVTLKELRQRMGFWRESSYEAPVVAVRRLW